MYSPAKDGIEKSTLCVEYTEAKPPSELSEFVHCFWELKTVGVLADDFCLHVLPDACVNILFNIQDNDIAAITARQTTYVVLNLGKSFHYTGVQLLPVVWQGNRNEIFDSFVDKAYSGSLPLKETNKRLTGLDFAAKQPILSELVKQLIDDKLVKTNSVVAKILANIDNINTVADMAAITHISTRHLQRILKQATGFTPHNFLKVLRFQKSFDRDYLVSYADQSHFIHSFRKITGLTPGEYFKKFNV